MKRGSEDRTIDARDLLSQKIRRRDGLLTVVLWVAYAYLWLPLISLGAWYLGIEFAWRLVEQAGGPTRLGHLLVWFALFTIVAAGGVIGWSGWQRARFRDDERRRRAPVVTDEQEIEYWQLERGRFDRLRNAQRVLVELDSQGRFLLVADRSQHGVLVPDD